MGAQGTVTKVCGQCSNDQSSTAVPKGTTEAGFTLRLQAVKDAIKTHR